jgi:putative ABC transport system substrate-binding protein
MNSVSRVGLTLLLAGLAASLQAQAKVGILLWNNQPRYTQCEEGVLAQLKEEGFAPPKVSFTVEQADGNRTTVTELTKKFAAAHFDLVIPIGTMAASTVADQIKDVPVVFAFVFDPVGSKIAADWKSSGNNTTGSSSKTSAPMLLRTLRKLAPVHTLAVLYTPGEKNTEVQLADLQLLKDFQITILPVPLKSRAEVLAEVSQLEGKVEAIVLTGSSIVGDAAAQIVVLANKAKIITATQSDDHMDKGVLLGVTVNPGAVGRLAGKKAAQVLRGTKPAALEIEALKSSDVSLNMGTAKAIGLTVPPAVQKEATRLIQ